MVTKPTFRTDDGTRWGTGQGSNLTANQVDDNFWDMYTSLLALEEHQDTLASIASANIVGNQLFFHLTNGAVLGPLTVPSAQWNPKGTWQPGQNYAPFDVVTINGAVYLVTVPVTSVAPFNPNLTDGQGHLVYMLLLEQPNNALPNNGNAFQKLIKSSGSPYVTEWADDNVRIFTQCIGQPNAGELLLQFPVVDHLTLPAGLAKSVAYNGTPPANPSIWTLARNGDVVGTITFDPSLAPAVSLSEVDLIPGDILTLIAPSSPDLVQANISFTLVAIITG